VTSGTGAKRATYVNAIFLTITRLYKF